MVKIAEMISILLQAMVAGAVFEHNIPAAVVGLLSALVLGLALLVRKEKAE